MSKRTKKPSSGRKSFRVYVSRRGRARRCVANLTQKREAIREAKRRAYPRRGGSVARQVSAYEVTRGGREDLRYQVHYSRKLGRLIAEEL